MRVGIGYDIHRLQKSRKLILGGVQIPYPKGLLGHSDGDVIIHAIVDAIFGALALGDIGDHFSDKDKRYKNANSKQFADYALLCLKKKKMKLRQLDLVLIAERPKLASYKIKIRQSIAAIFHLNETCVGFKAKTNEGLDALGKIQAIACHAIVLIG